MNDFGRGCFQQDPIGEVTVFGDDGKLVFFGIMPDFFVRPFIIKILLVNKIRMVPKGEVIWQVYID